MSEFDEVIKQLVDEDVLEPVVEESSHPYPLNSNLSGQVVVKGRTSLTDYEPVISVYKI